MDGTNQKVSFIPKGSLVHEQSFLERKRPQSAISFIAALIFVLVVGAYIGLYYYNSRLNSEVGEKRAAINKTQQGFRNAPEVAEARVFRARADIAREILNSHRVVSPMFEFLSENTTESIMYDNFSFKNDAGGAALNLSGEALNYASLAYQSDVFRSKKSELLKFSVNNVALTKFGTVTFDFVIVFKPDFLLYVKNVNDGDVAESQSAVQTSVITDTDTGSALIPEGEIDAEQELPPVTTAQSPSVSESATDLVSEARVETISTTTSKIIDEPSMLIKIWSRFKFW